MKDTAIKLCLLVRENAIARITKVGAVFYADEELCPGWNIENRCHKGMHAEEVAILHSRLRGYNPKSFKGIIIVYGDGSTFFPACGHCRQALWEYTFNPELLITVIDLEGNIIGEKRLDELYPYPYPLESFRLDKKESK